MRSANDSTNARATLTNASTSLRRIPLGIWMLGFVSMLADISSEMVHSLLPMFMVFARSPSSQCIQCGAGRVAKTVRRE